MVKFSRDDVLKLAHLAQLELDENEISEFSEELSAILEYVEQLQSADIGDLKPTDQVTGLTNVMRPDKVIDYGYTADDLLKNVPKTEGRQIKVGRVI